MTNVTHEKVRHRQFGVGTVTGQTDTTVTVTFCETFGIRKFQCPLAFESYLELCSPAAKQAMDRELQQLREQAAAEQKSRTEELEQRREEKRRMLFSEKKAVHKSARAKKSGKSSKSG